MLHKSFKPAKCKTALKLATSRIKLMRNKKGVQINQLKRDLAQLLATGQDRTARIRVEHVIREEKMVAAYDLIEIYCELIVARLPIIESQKACPIDLKEAVTSVIFAAPRCSDISELSDIRKQFTKKYGKEFVSAAIELRPDCGVSRMLVEKLSAVAPDLQTKIKVLSTIAKENNIEFDPTSFEEKESKPPEDLLNGPANIEKASMRMADSSNIQASNVDGVHTREEKQDGPFDFAQQNKKYTLGTQNADATDTDARSSGTTSERMERRQPFPRGSEDDFSSSRQHWNMEFKDATSAAQAAAESAERAAMAARAAAQFSSQEKFAKQNPSRSHVSDFKNQTPRVSPPSGSMGKDSYENLPDDMNPKMSYSQTGQHGGNERSRIPTSFRSKNDSIGSFKNNDPIKDEKFVNDFPVEDRRFEESLHEDQETSSFPKKTTLEGSEESKSEADSGQKGRFESEDVNYFAEENSGRESKKPVVGNPYAFVDQVNLFRESTTRSSNLDAPRDDESISDEDNGPRFDTGFEYDEIQSEPVFTSLGTRFPQNDDVWSHQVSSKSHLFSESHSVKSVETNDRVSASFDQSDGSDSESERKDFPSTVHDIFSSNPTENVKSEKSRIQLEDLVDSDEEERPLSQDSSNLFLGGHDFKKSNLNQVKKSNLDQVSDSDDNRKELNFGTLTGGLRHKTGIRFPPYKKPAETNDSYVSKESIEESQTKVNQSSLDSKVSKLENRKPSVSISDSDSDDDNDKFSIKSEKTKTSKQGNRRSLFLPPAAFFDDDDDTSDSGEVKEQAPSKVRLASGISRRTKGSPPVSHSKSHTEPEVKPVSWRSREDKKHEVPVETKSARTAVPGGEMPSGAKRQSHVHPNLPDYESLAARLQSLRSDHK